MDFPGFPSCYLNRSWLLVLACCCNEKRQGQRQQQRIAAKDSQ